MKDRYNKKKVRTFKVGDAVSVRIPRIDRAATDLHHLPCIVVARHRNKHFQYRLQCKYGLLKNSHPESKLEAFAGAQQMSNIHNWEEAPVVSLHEELSQLIPAMPSMEQFVTARKAALENSAPVRRLESHAPQDATQGDPV